MRTKNEYTGVLERSPQQQGNEVGRLSVVFFRGACERGRRRERAPRERHRAWASWDRGPNTRRERSEHEVATAQRARRMSSEITSRGGTEVRAE